MANIHADGRLEGLLGPWQHPVLVTEGHGHVHVVTMTGRGQRDLHHMCALATVHHIRKARPVHPHHDGGPREERAQSPEVTVRGPRQQDLML